VPFYGVAPGYFATLQIPLTAGRDFTLRDDSSAPRVVIVNEEFVHRFMSGEHALGQRISTEWPNGQNLEIVGIAANIIPYSLWRGIRPCVFVPFFQLPPSRMSSGTFEVRAAGSLSSVGSVVSGVLSRALPDTLIQARAFSDQIDASIRPQIVMAQLVGFFGALALVLAAAGLYGLLAYLVTQRTGEIGIRMALGAQRQQVLWAVLHGALRLVFVGVLIGLAPAWWASRFLKTLLFGVSPMDPLTIAAAVVLLAAAALFAGFLPAHRASRVDPIVALRYD
jgi:predicted permease